MEWINVKDELPEFEQPIIALKNNSNRLINWLCGYGNRVFIGRLISCKITKDDNKEYTWEFDDGYCFTDVSHWMPLPKPPKN
jgi:Protein of unknown function (DUF551)